MKPKSNVYAPNSVLKGYDDLISSVDQKQIVVLELGTLTLRIGYSGEDEPELAMPACMALLKPSNKSDFTQSRLKKYFGAEALKVVEARGEYELVYPLAGERAEPEHLEAFFKHVFEEELNSDPMRLDLFVVEPFSLSARRLQLCELFFEFFRVQSLNFVPSALCSLLYAGATTGLSVEAGEAFTSIVPVFEGFVLRNRVKHLPYAGSRASEVVASFLQGSAPSSGNPAGLFRAIKEKVAVAAEDYEREIARAEPLPAEERFYELSDGQLVELSRKAIFDAGEVLFCPAKVLQQEAEELCEEVVDAITCGDPDTQRRLCESIVLSGGAALTKGYFERFSRDVRRCAEGRGIPHALSVTRAPDIPHSAWIGGSILASITTVQNLKIKKAQYEESENKEALFRQKVL